MKNIILAGLFIFGLTGIAQAATSIFVDAAPNKYGSPNYNPWQTNAYANVTAGTFVNMANGTNSANIGTTNFEIQDEVVYSFGDLGKRLTWIYYLEGSTVEELQGTNRFQISLTNVWDGSSLDFYNSYYGNTWLEPGSWSNYDSNGDGITDGVIGTAGMAWWGAYNVNTQAALDADLASWGLANESWTFTTRFDGKLTSVTSYRTVPEVTTVLLFSTGLAILAGFRIRRKKL